MTEKYSFSSPLSQALKGKRKAVPMTSTKIVEWGLLQAEQSLPLVIKPSIAGINLASWVSENKEFIETHLLEHGALLLRGFPLNTAQDFQQVVEALSGELLPYAERSSPRKQVEGNIYTSTDYPEDQSLFLHNENSYQLSWPLKLYFFAAVAPTKGGETPIADCRKVWQHINPLVRERFMQKGVMYLRNFNERLGLSWQTVFQTTLPGIVEQYCQRNGIDYEWITPDQLRTRAVRPAIVRHPRSGEWLWFNHATFFHYSTLPEMIRTTLFNGLTEEELPSNTYYGDGSAIELEVLDELREAYQKETVIFSWQAGDVLLLDNMLVAHGRMPYSGTRKILVAMREGFSYE